MDDANKKLESGTQSVYKRISRQIDRLHVNKVLTQKLGQALGGQATLGFTVVLKAIAQGAGYQTVLQAVTTEEITEALNIMTSADHPSLLEIRVCRGDRADLGRPTTTLASSKQALMTWLHNNDD